MSISNIEIKEISIISRVLWVEFEDGTSLMISLKKNASTGKWEYDHLVPVQLLNINAANNIKNGDEFINIVLNHPLIRTRLLV